ncbi:unnamed protein product [Symbiodinium sp. CCMP2592]|nr:unnamed protein product [Symbiodinium sp. CCMP2592]
MSRFPSKKLLALPCVCVRKLRSFLLPLSKSLAILPMPSRPSLSLLGSPPRPRRSRRPVRQQWLLRLRVRIRQGFTQAVPVEVVKPTRRVKDAPSKAKDDPTTKVDHTTSKINPTSTVKDPPSKAKDDPATKVKPTHKLAAAVATEKPADPNAIQHVEPTPQLIAFWDKYKVSNKGTVHDTLPESTVPEDTLDDTHEEGEPRLRRGRASIDLGESLNGENALPPVAVRRGWSCGTLLVADQQLSKQRGIDAAETIVMENASQVLAGQLDVPFCLLVLGGSVSQTGSSSSSAECLQLRQMVEQMQIYQSALVGQLKANGQELPPMPSSLEVPAVEDRTSSRAPAEREVAPVPDDDMDGDSMHSEDGEDDGEAGEAPDGEGDDEAGEVPDGSADEAETDQEGDASMHDGLDDDENASCPAATKSVKGLDKTKILEDDPMIGKSMQPPRRACQPSSQPIFAPESVASSPAVVPAVPPAAPVRAPSPAPATMEPPAEEVVNSRTHKREYMVLVILANLKDRQELLKRWVMSGGNTQATEASIEASRTSRSKAKTVRHSASSTAEIGFKIFCLYSEFLLNIGFASP